jgi:hypothetical protein
MIERAGSAGAPSGRFGRERFKVEHEIYREDAVLDYP